MKKGIEYIMLTALVILSAFLCFILLRKPKVRASDSQRAVYDSTIKLGHDKVRQKQDTINILHEKRQALKKKIVQRKLNIATLEPIDTAQTLSEYKVVTGQMEKVIFLGDSILVLKNDQLRIQDSMLHAAKVEIKRLDDTISLYHSENKQLKAEIIDLNKKLKRKKRLNAILISSVLAIGYLTLNK